MRLQAERIDPGGLSAKLLSWLLYLLPYAPDCGLLCEYLHAVPNLHVLVSKTAFESVPIFAAWTFTRLNLPPHRFVVLLRRYTEYEIRLAHDTL